MESFWQHALVTLAALAAGGWLVRHRLKNRKRGCSSCSSSELNAPAKGMNQVIPVSSLKARKRSSRSRQTAGR